VSAALAATALPNSISFTESITHAQSTLLPSAAVRSTTSTPVGLILGIIAGIVLIVAIALILFLVQRRRSKDPSSHEMSISAMSVEPQDVWEYENPMTELSDMDSFTCDPTVDVELVEACAHFRE
jgi:hypothetical protein